MIVTEFVNYRVVFVETDRRVLAINRTDGHCLPEVQVPSRNRPAEEVQSACLEQWNLHVLVVKFFTTRLAPQLHYVIVQLLVPGTNPALIALPSDNIAEIEHSEELRSSIASVFDHDLCHSMARVGWIDEAIRWAESSTRCKLSSRADVKQFNAGDGFALLRFIMADGSKYWLKATKAPNAHEYGITEYLSKQNRATAPYLPRLISTHAEWNAWLMSGEGNELPEISNDALDASPILKDAAVSLARLQIGSVTDTQALLRLGASDQRFPKLLSAAPELFDYIQTSMCLQTSTRVARIEPYRLSKLLATFEATCKRMEDLDLPISLVHGDLNRGNILRKDHCVFIDWSEAGVGVPFVSLQHLLLLNRVSDDAARSLLDQTLKQCYRDEWRSVCDLFTLDLGLRYMPFLAAASAMYGRGDWLHSSDRNAPNRFAYARTLARHMDRAAREMELEVTPCS